MLVRARAFGVGCPSRDLVLSPDHALFLDGVLVPVKHPVNGRSVAHAPGGCQTYWHVELAMHDVVLAEGLAVETFLDVVGQHAGFDDARRVLVHPGHAAREWDARGCARLVVNGPAIAAVHRRLSRTLRRRAA